MKLLNQLQNTDEEVVYVYQWGGWNGSLFPSLCPNAIRIEGRGRQFNFNIIRKLKAWQGYFLFHINLTNTTHFFKNKEALLLRLRDRNILPLNAKVDDTSKKHLQYLCKQLGLNTTIAQSVGHDDELLIVKTNFNYGGRAEKKLMGAASRILNVQSLDYDTEVIYPVLERKKVKNEDWNNENMTIEKFIANKSNHIYRVYKLLNRIVVSEVIEDSLIKKLRVVTERTNYFYDLDDITTLTGENLKFHDLLADIIRLSNAMHLDFAAIDVVKCDGNKYYIIDVNLTPNWSRKDYPELLHFLAGSLKRK